MIWKTLAVATAAAMLAAPALAAPDVGGGLPFTIAEGQRIVLTQGSGGQFTIRRVEPLTTPPEGRAAPQGATSEHMYAVPDATFNAPAGALVFSLWDSAAEGARLKLENGTDAPLIYSAVIVMRSSGRAVATTICSVAPGHSGFETWPDDIAAIRITGVYPAPGPKVCGYPEKGELSAPPSDAPDPGAQSQ